MRDIKYILKRIIIGVGIVLCLSCINRCKVKAWNYTNNYRTVSKNSILNNSDIILLKTYNYISFYKNNINNSVYFCSSYSNNCYEMYFDNFNYQNIGLLIGSPLSSSNTIDYNSCAYLSENELPKFYSGGGTATYNHANYNSNTYVFCVYSKNSSNTFGLAMYSYVSSGEDTEAFYWTNINPSVNNSDYQFFSNINWNYFGNLTISSDNIINIGGIPDFVSFNAVPNLYDNVIISYNVRPEFSVFDNDNYKYQYSFDAKRWLGLNENKQLLKINNNTTIYVRILKRENDEYINGATLTISQIGTFYNDDIDYKVNISGEYRTENYINNSSSSKSKSNISEYQIYTDFIPNSSILKYQYQWVNNDSEFSEDNWLNINKLEPNDFGDFTYVVSENGTFYARILDKDNNYLASATFTVNSIGKLALDNNQELVDNFLTRLGSKIDFGGPVGSLLLVPVNFLNSIYSPMSNSNTCSNLELGSLLGTNLYLPCVNVRRYLGSNVYNIIDLIMSFFLILGIIKMSINLYNKFISMRDISS